MKSTLGTATVLVLVAIAIGQEQQVSSQSAQRLNTERAKLSYALGMDLGRQLREKKVDVDPSLFSRGLADALTGGTLLLTEKESQVLVSALQEKLQRQEFAKVALTAERNARDGEAFLDANKSKSGVVALASGLQYRVLKAGAGAKPTIDDTVTCHYRGTFIDGTEFDSSYSRGEPFTAPLRNVIKGWSEALQLMPVGSKWQLVVPSELAYGSRGAGGRIGPNSTLIFEIELMSIK
jgi:FKBP-type peptidyl-prolyl cis-trans isomerase FklB